MMASFYAFRASPFLTVPESYWLAGLILTLGWSW
jgi:hypothetical protein